MRLRRAAALAAAGMLAGGLLTGCADRVRPPGEATTDVDTPKLRELKAQAGIDDCVPGSGEPVEGGLPEVTLPCLGGGEDIDLSALRGPLVVNLWGAWCFPCVEEMPAIATFYERYGDQVPVLGVDYQDKQPKAALELARDSSVTYPSVADPQGDLRAKDPFPAGLKVPSFVFVDEDGGASLVLGGIDSPEELVDLVEEHLGVTL